MKKLPLLLALMASHVPSSMMPKARRPKPLSNPFADRDAIEKAKQKRIRKTEKLARYYKRDEWETPK